MALVTVHNISDRPNTPGTARAILIGNQKLRPGKHIEIDDSVINRKLQELQGNLIWIGELPGRFTRTSQSGQEVQEKLLQVTKDASAPMEFDEARAYLAALESPTLLQFCVAMSPELSFAKEPPQPILVQRVARALFTSGRILDPEVFFWLRRWCKEKDTYVEKE